MKSQPDSTKAILAAWAIQEYRNYRSGQDRMSPEYLVSYLKFFVQDCERRNVPEFGYETAKNLLAKVQYDHPQVDDSIVWTKI